MGWTSTGDPMSNLVMKFETAEEATKFADKMGWDYEVEQPSVRKNYRGRKSYHHNFLTLANENELSKGGRKKGAIEYKHAARTSQWCRTLKYHGDDEVTQHGGNKHYEGDQSYTSPPKSASA